MNQAPPPSLSIFRKRWRKFRSLKRGYYSFLAILVVYLVSFVLPLLVSNQPLVVRYQGEYYFPKLHFHSPAEFGLEAIGEPDYRKMKEQFAAEGDANWVLLPPYPYSPSESLLELEGVPPHPPSIEHPFGTDDRGRDVFARLAYGFNISMTFALLVLLLSFGLGIAVGGLIGYFGGKLDILGQRFVEIWSSLPFLYTIMIVSSIVVPVYLPGRSQLVQPSFWLLIFIMSAFGWMGITYYIRGEFYREKAKDYVGLPSQWGRQTGPSCSSIFCPTPSIRWFPLPPLPSWVISERCGSGLSGIRPACSHSQLG